MIVVSDTRYISKSCVALSIFFTIVSLIVFVAAISRSKFFAHQVDRVHKRWLTHYRHLLAVETTTAALSETWESALSSVLAAQQGRITQLVQLVETAKQSLQQQRIQLLTSKQPEPVTPQKSTPFSPSSSSWSRGSTLDTKMTLLEIGDEPPVKPIRKQQQQRQQKETHIFISPTKSKPIPKSSSASKRMSATDALKASWREEKEVREPRNSFAVNSRVRSNYMSCFCCSQNELNGSTVASTKTSQVRQGNKNVLKFDFLYLY